MRRWLVRMFALFGGLALAWRIVDACAPQFAVAVFHYARHPDFPRSRFLNGHLGILQPTWARSYLVLSWRRLTGVGLDARERQQAADYYKDRQTDWWDKTGVDWEARWEQVRSRVPGMPAVKKRLLTEGKHAWNPSANTFELNCAEDAFRTAANTLNARIGRYGVRSREVLEWTLAQNQVFSNCDGIVKSIPEMAAGDLPAQIQSDRRYQIAAALFYAGELVKARDAFAEIAKDTKSEWVLISRYLVLRTLLRMSPEGGSDFLHEAEMVLADPKQASIHAMTDNLMRRYELREPSEETFRRLARLVGSRGQGNGLREALWNYTTHYDNLIGEASPNAFYVDAKAPKADPKLFEGDDMTAWIFHFQSRDPASGKVALARWKRSRSLPWLLASLRHADFESAQRNGLMEAARAVPENSPAYETAAWHYYRLLLDGKAKEEARAGLDAMLAREGLTKSSVNLFRSLRMSAARDLTDFFRFGAHLPLMITFGDNFAETVHSLFGEDRWGRELLAPFDIKAERWDEFAADAINNQMPLRSLRELALSGHVPPHLRRELLLSALTRALVLDLKFKDIAEKLRETDPVLATRAQAIVDADSRDPSRFAAAHLLLWQPEAKPFVSPGIFRQTANGKLDDYRDNWWCPVLERDPTVKRGVASLSFSSYDFYYEEAAEPPPLYSRKAPSFLTADELAESAAERKRLIASGRAMDVLGGIVLEWAKTHPDDPRIPEALHRVVRGARVNCDGERDTKINWAAFRLLKTRYRNTTWARKTTVL